MDHDETGCQAPERPILCIQNCGFFGRAATMNMCSKCHKETVVKEENAKLAASSIENIVNGGSSKGKEPIISTGFFDTKPACAETKAVNAEVSFSFGAGQTLEPKKAGPSRCLTCNKRVGLTGFNCKCGHIFCSSHRYSDKHDCPFDYHAAAQNAIAKANPVVKAEKLDKI